MCRSRRNSRMSSMRPRSPISSPAKAIAVARLPTPGGPWEGYACAGPSSAIAARSSRFASACSEMFSKLSTDLLVQFIRRPRAVEQDDAIRVLPRDYAVSVGYALPELRPFSLDAVRALSHTARGRVGIDLEHERDVRQERARGAPVQLVDLL